MTKLPWWLPFNCKHHHTVRWWWSFDMRSASCQPCIIPPIASVFNSSFFVHPPIWFQVLHLAHLFTCSKPSSPFLIFISSSHLIFLRASLWRCWVGSSADRWHLRGIPSTLTTSSGSGSGSLKTCGQQVLPGNTVQARCAAAGHGAGNTALGQTGSWGVPLGDVACKQDIAWPCSKAERAIVPCHGVQWEDSIWSRGIATAVLEVGVRHRASHIISRGISYVGSSTVNQLSVCTPLTHLEDQLASHALITHRPAYWIVGLYYVLAGE